MLGIGNLGAKLVVIEAGKVRMRERMRADLEAGLGKLAGLPGGHHPLLAIAGALVPFIDPAQRVHYDIDRGGHVALGKHGAGMLVDAQISVVEGDRECVTLAGFAAAQFDAVFQRGALPPSPAQPVDPPPQHARAYILARHVRAQLYRADAVVEKHHRRAPPCHILVQQNPSWIYY